MNLRREWVTPLILGTFLLIAVTGVLMFFHLDRGLNKVAHEWLSWAFIAVVGLHVVLNFGTLKRYAWWEKRGKVLVGLCVAVLALSFLNLPGRGEGGGEPPFAAPVRAMAQAPLTAVAQVAGVSVSELRGRLQQAGVTSSADTQTLQELVGPDLRRQINVLRQVLPAAAP